MKWKQISSREFDVLHAVASRGACFSMDLCVRLASMHACMSDFVLMSHAAWMTHLVLDVACASIGSLRPKL